MSTSPLKKPTPSFYKEMGRHMDLLSQIEAADGEMTEEIQELFSLNEAEIEKTAEQLVELRDTVVALNDSSEAIIAREKAKIEMNNRRLQLIDNRLTQAVQIVGPITFGSRYVAIKESQATDIFEPERIPSEYTRIKPAVAEQVLPDATKILKDLKKGIQIDGAKLKINKKLEVK